MGIACIPAIPVILKFYSLISIVIFAGNLILQGYYGENICSVVPLLVHE
jgi:hypothetical protein